MDIDLILLPLRRARAAYGGDVYADVLRALPQETVRSDRSALLYPDAVNR